MDGLSDFLINTYHFPTLATQLRSTPATTEWTYRYLTSYWQLSQLCYTLVRKKLYCLRYQARTKRKSRDLRENPWPYKDSPGERSEILGKPTTKLILTGYCPEPRKTRRDPVFREELRTEGEYDTSTNIWHMEQPLGAMGVLYYSQISYRP